LADSPPPTTRPQAPQRLATHRKEFPMRFPCPHCCAMLSAPREVAGRSSRCRFCGHPVTVPAGRRVPVRNFLLIASIFVSLAVLIFVGFTLLRRGDAPPREPLPRPPAKIDPTQARLAHMKRYADMHHKGKTLKQYVDMANQHPGDATMFLAEAGAPAVPFLVQLMTDSNLQVRVAAAVALTMMADGGRDEAWDIPRTPAARDALIEGTTDPNALIRLHSIAVLTTCPVDNGVASPRFRKAAEGDPDPRVREAARQALMKRGLW
jgi:hypothetical protein